MRQAQVVEAVWGTLELLRNQQLGRGEPGQSVFVLGTLGSFKETLDDQLQRVLRDRSAIAFQAVDTQPDKATDQVVIIFPGSDAHELLHGAVEIAIEIFG